MTTKIYQAMVERKFCKKTWRKIKHCIISCFNGTYWRKLLNKIDTQLAKIARHRLAMTTPVQKNKILFITTRGSYNCNPKAIANEIIRQGLPWELVWVARKEDFQDLEQYPEELHLVCRDSFDFYKAAASAKVWIDNAMSLAYSGAVKKKEQVLIQTWHGSIGLKRFETNSDKVWIKNACLSGKQTDYCISNSTFETELFQNTFWSSANILEYGHARNDILLNCDEIRQNVIRHSVQMQLHIPSGVKVALYAPTFRDNKKLDAYEIDYELLKETLEKRFGGTWVILSRLHFEVKKLLKKKHIKYPECVIDATEYPDIQDLLFIADVGITDYSSWICDFVLTRRPAFFFATDMRKYYVERGFYYPLESTPFPIAKNNAELEEMILNFDEKSYIEHCDSFIAEKGCIDDGHAAERVVKKLKEIVEGKE